MIKIRSGILVVLFAISGSSPIFAGKSVEAITKPSKDVTLSFVQPGRIAKVLVKEGDIVKTGQLLVQQDDAAEQVLLAQLKAKAEDTTKIEAAEAQLAQKKVDLKRLQWAAQRGAATKLEVDHARLDVVIADLSLKLARFEHAQDIRKYTEAKIRLSRMRLTSPIEGKVEKIFAKTGESVDALKEVVRVVNTDLLWIDVPVPLKQARSLRKGQKAIVEFPPPVDAGETQGNAPATQYMERTIRKGALGKIIYIASVADAASETLMVRVELSNPSGRPAGEKVHVKFLPDEQKKVSGSKSGPAGNRKLLNRIFNTDDVEDVRLVAGAG